MARRKKILKQAFVVTVSAGAAVVSGAAGCDNELISTNNPPVVLGCEETGDCPSLGCPESRPAQGSACPEEDLSCFYGDGGCDDEEARCQDGTWDIFPASSCNPPPPECPQEEPVIHEICEPQSDTWGIYPSWCQYPVQTPCGEQTKTLSCMTNEIGEMAWAVEEAPVACEVTPDQCHAHGDISACDAEANCVWHVPGCAEGDNPLTEGCHPVQDCLQEGCGDWGTCITGTMDPCYDSFCNACGAEVNVCQVTAMP